MGKAKEILLVNNSTAHLRQLGRALSGNSVEVITYQPGVEFDLKGKDLIVLSGGGGEGREANDRQPNGHLWYEDEIKLIQGSPVPVLGICMGFELICQAHGGQIEAMERGFEGPKLIRTDGHGMPGTLSQIASHEWHVPETPAGLKQRGFSATGVEIVEEPGRLFGVQFHPELGGTLLLPQLIDRMAA